MKIFKADYRGELEIGDMKISCAVLEDGTRIISENSIVRYLGSVGGKNYKLRAKENNNIDFLPLFVASKAIQPFIDEVFNKEDLLPISYTTDGKNRQKGYDATILPKVCEVWLKAREEKTLQVSQLPKALKAEILMRSLAKIAITALVDEATGYQYDREKYELQKIFKAYISEELLPWQKMFPDIFYKELFRLNGWSFDVKGIKKRPGVIGTWTKKLIYEELPKGILEELEKNTPRSISGNKTARLHQSLTIDIGNSHLKEQINKCITLFQLSDNMEHMWYNFKKIKDRQKGQLNLPFEFDKEGYTIEVSENKKNIPKKSKNTKSKKNKQPRLFD